MVVAREWERGTMEALMVTPLRIRELLAGKLIPYFVLGMGGHVVHAWPWRCGSSMCRCAAPSGCCSLASALFMLVALAMGLLISIVAKNQFVAGQIAIVVTFLPAFILSGFIFDIGSMPCAGPAHHPPGAGALLRGHPADACSWPATSGR